MIYRYFRNVISLLSVMGSIILFTSQTVSAWQAGQQSIETIDTYIKEQVNRLEIPGIAIGIVRGEDVVYVQGYGRADDTGRAMTPDTPFLVASLSKQTKIDHHNDSAGYR